jgi:uncharacterized membrane protein
MSRLLGYFARGCLAIIPIALTVYILWAIVSATDSLLGISIPGLGIVVTVGLITAIGFLISNVIGRRIFWLLDQVMARVPLVKLLYKSIRDLLQAFVGSNESIGKPVVVQFSKDSSARVMGLLTRRDLSALNLTDHVAVYIPQAYNVGGQVLAVRRDQVEEIDIPAAEMLTFMMSGGAAGLGVALTKTPPLVEEK